MNPLVSRVVLPFLVLALGAYGFVTLNGPRGIAAMRASQSQIRWYEEQNINLERDIALRKQRLEKWEKDVAEQDRIVREKLKKVQKDDIQFILPHDSSQPAPAAETAEPSPK